MVATEYWEFNAPEENNNDPSDNSSGAQLKVGKPASELKITTMNAQIFNPRNNHSRQSTGDYPSQHEDQPDLGFWTQAVSETIHSMKVAHRAVENLQNKLGSHEDDLSMVDEIKPWLSQLEQAYNNKDKELERCEKTI